MPDLKRVRGEIERAQDEALAKLRQAQLTDALYLAASQRVVSLTLNSLRLLDQAYLEVEAFVSQGGRSEAHEQWLNERTAHLLRSLEHAIADILASAISQVRADLPHTRPREKVVREVIVHPPAREWPEPLPTLAKLFKGLLQYAAFVFLLGILFENPYIAIFVPIGTYYFLHEGGFLAWGIIPSLIAVVVWVILLIL